MANGKRSRREEEGLLAAATNTAATNDNSIATNTTTRRQQWITRALFYAFVPLAVIVSMSFRYGFNVNAATMDAVKEMNDFLTPNQPLESTNTNSTSRQQAIRHRREEEEKEETQDSETGDTVSHEPLNVVLFYADDWTMKVLGKLNPDVITPNIDQMADKGVIFTDNCVTTSMCWISRASLVTGTYASRHLQLEPPLLNMFTTHPWNQTLFPLMKQQGGYYTGIVGKWHAPQPSEYMPMTFDYSNFYFGSHWEERDGKTVHVTDLNRQDSLKFLRERPRDKKFFLKVSFFATHAWDGHYPSYEPKNETKAAYYNNVTIPSPKTATDQHWKDLPSFFLEGNEGRNRWRKRFEPDYYQDNIKDLYRMATEVDSAIGDIIEELKQQGVYDNTMLIFTTDNGNLHGEHGLAEKWYPFEESIRVPLVIQDPRMPRDVQGTRIDKLTLNIDLAPTILGAANIQPSYFMQGRDIAQLYLGSQYNHNHPLAGREHLPWREEYFYEYNRGDPITAEGHDGKFWIDASFALVTKEWKYIYWPQHDYEQLFHRSLDPYDEWDHLNRSTVQTNNETYIRMKQRYNTVKEWVQSGKRC